jgi:hypothetical protein
MKTVYKIVESSEQEIILKRIEYIKRNFKTKQKQKT